MRATQRRRYGVAVAMHGAFGVFEPDDRPFRPARAAGEYHFTGPCLWHGQRRISHILGQAVEQAARKVQLSLCRDVRRQERHGARPADTHPAE